MWLVYFYLLCLWACALLICWKERKKKRISAASFLQAKPPLHTFHALPGRACLPNQDWRALGLQSGWLSETIRPRDGSGSLPLDSVPHSIYEAFHLWRSKGLCGAGVGPCEKQQGNRLCNVFGGVVLVFTVSADLWQAEPPPR